MPGTDVLDDAGIDWSSELSDDTVTATDGPLPGSRGTSTARTTTGQRRGRRVAVKRLQTLQEKLSDEMFQAGAMIGMGLPVTGYYTCQESDNFTKAVVQLASKNTRWVEALENLALIQPGIVVGRTAVGLGAALAVDRGRADPERQFMKFLGVYSAWNAVQNPDMKEGESVYVPPPRTFAPVT
jgi:hypothetical protein